MGAEGFLAAFVVLACLGSGAFLLQGVQAARYSGERLNKPVAIVAAVASLVAIVCFALRLGHWERLFGGFSNLTSGITLLLYATVLFVAAAIVMLVMAVRSEDGSVPRWCGVAAIVTSVILVVCTALGSRPYVKATALTPDMYALALYYAGLAFLLGSLVLLVLGAAMADDASTGLARRLVLVAALVTVVALGVYLGVYSMDHQAAKVASQAAYSMNTFTVGAQKAAAVVGAGQKVAELVAGAGAPVFWGLTVVGGIVVPAGAGVVARMRSQRALMLAAGLVGLVCALAGAACFLVSLA